MGYLQLPLQWTYVLAKICSLQPGNDVRSSSQMLWKEAVHFPHEARTKRRRLLSVHEVPFTKMSTQTGRTLIVIVCMIYSTVGLLLIVVV